MTRMLTIHRSFYLLLRNQGLSPVSHIQVMSRCSGAGREHSQADGPSWPVEIFLTMDGMLSLGMGTHLGGGGEQISMFFALFFWEFKLLQDLGLFFRSSKKFIKSTSSIFHSCCSGTGYTICRQMVRKYCIVYCLFCIFIIITSSSSNIAYVALLNCLYLNPRVSSFVHFSSPPLWGGRGDVSERPLGPSCQLLD